MYFCHRVHSREENFNPLKILSESFFNPLDNLLNQRLRENVTPRLLLYRKFVIANGKLVHICGEQWMYRKFRVGERFSCVRVERALEWASVTWRCWDADPQTSCVNVNVSNLRHPKILISHAWSHCKSRRKSYLGDRKMMKFQHKKKVFIWKLNPLQTWRLPGWHASEQPS